MSASRSTGRGHTALSRQDDARLGDIIEAIDAIRAHLTRGDLHDGLGYGVVRVHLIEIGEAVKGIRPDLGSARSKIRRASRTALTSAWMVDSY